MKKNIVYSVLFVCIVVALFFIWSTLYQNGVSDGTYISIKELTEVSVGHDNISVHFVSSHPVEHIALPMKYCYLDGEMTLLDDPFPVLRPILAVEFSVTVLPDSLLYRQSDSSVFLGYLYPTEKSTQGPVELRISMPVFIDETKGNTFFVSTQNVLFYLQ